MKKHMKKFILGFLVVMMTLTVAPFTEWGTIEADASSATYDKEYYYTPGTQFISDLAIGAREYYWAGSGRQDAAKEYLTNAGYSLLGKELNAGKNGYYIHMGFKKSTDESTAIRAIGLYNGGTAPASFTYNINGYDCTFYPVTTSFVDSGTSTGAALDLNKGVGGDTIYLYYTRDPNAGPPMTRLEYGTSGTFSGLVSCCWINTNGDRYAGDPADFNRGVSGSDDIFVYWAQENSTEVDTSALHTAITTADSLLANSANYVSVDALQTAVNTGKAIVNDYNADGLSASYNQTAITDAANAINNAINALQTTVTLNGNGGTVSASSFNVTVGSATTVNYNVSSYTASRTGYTFKGWATSASATSGSTSTVSAGLKPTLYAVWEANKYTVMLDNLLDFSKWNTNGAQFSNVGNGGFTLTNTNASGELTSTSPFFPVEPGKQYKIDIDITGDAWDVYIFFCDANGAWVDFKDGPTNRYSAGASTGIPADNAVFTAPNKTEVVKAQIRVDTNNPGNSVTFKNIRVYEVGTVADGVSYVGPQTVTYDSTYGLPTPTRAGYDFVGWFDANGNQVKATDTVKITDTLYLTSQWKVQEYTVTWKNHDGSVLETDTKVAYGATPTFNGNTPVKQGNAQYSYTFTGWSPSLSPVTGDVTYTAQFSQSVNKYKVEWKNYDGAVLETDNNVVYGATPEYNGANPTRPATKQYTYTFAGWTPTVDKVTGNVVYTAKFTETVNNYKVVWQNYDGTVLETDDAVPYGTVPTFNGVTPVKPETAQFTYTFIGWTPAVEAITGNTTYTATFEQKSKAFTVVWQNYDGTVLETDNNVAYGTTPSFDKSAPVKPGNAQYSYTFTGWSPAVSAVTGNVTYIAQFEESVNTYVITWTFADGSKQTVELSYGAAITAPANSTKAPDATNHYSYAWDPSVSATVTGTAAYTEKLSTVGHNWADWVVTDDPSCTETGSRERTCNDCGYKATETLDVVDHTPSEAVTENFVDSTCTAKGSYDSVVYCSVCKTHVISRDTIVIDEKAHTPAAAVKENEVNPDCENDGSYDSVVYCSVCKTHVISRETITVGALGHTDGETVIENKVDPDCVNNGSYEEVVYCTVCGDELSRNKVTVGALGHTNSEVKIENNVDATCTTAGSYDKVIYCTVCTAEVSREKVTVGALGHTDGDAVIENNKAATCTADGSYDSVTYCTVCKAETSRKTVVVPSTGHTAADAVEENKKDSTCAKEGSYDSVVYCSVCDAELSRNTNVIPVKPHTHGEEETENFVDSTCTSKGSYDIVVYCTVCTTELSRNTYEITEKAHTPSAAVKENEVDPDCVNTGSYDSVVYCSVCKTHVISRETITVSALGHTSGSVVIENKVDETCTADGSYDEVVYCTVCDAEVSRVTKTVGMLGHNFSTEWTTDVEPTCTTTGSKSHHCSRCDAKSDVTEIPENGHSAAAAVKENVINATCGSDGSYDNVVYCSVCNAELSRDTITVDATGEHVYAKELERDDATCTEDGYVKLACGCNDNEYIIETLPATGHKYVPVVTPPTCTDEGYTTYTCSKCNDTYVSNIVPENGHSAGSVVIENNKAPDCDDTGSYDEVTYCTVCGTETSRKTITVPSEGHNYSDVVTPPTCTDDGYTTYTCSKCGDTYTDNSVDALGHTDAAAVQENVVKATCTSKGSYDSVVYCSVCGEELSRNNVVVDEIPHNSGSEFKANEVKPGCTTTGSYDLVTECTVCGTETSRTTVTVDSLGHNAGVPTTENNVPATCTNDGSYDTVVYCTRCNSQISRETTVVPAFGHTNSAPVIENNIAPDCENDGSYDTVVYCKTCGTEISRVTTTVDALGHTDGEKVIENNVDPDCENDGSYDEVVYCTVCGEELSRNTVTVDALGHTDGEKVIENNVKPDCENDGSYDEVVYCTVCGEELSRNTVTVDALGHTDGEKVIENNVDPDCENAGSYDEVVYCTVCGEELSRNTVTVDALGHTDGEAVIENNVDPDCVNAGSYDEVVYCTVCDAELSRKTITVDALGHTAGTAVKENENAPDCVNGGSYEEVVYCTVCGAELSRKTITVDALGHTAGTAVRENEVIGNCITGSTYDEVVYCTVCGEELSREHKIVASGSHKPGAIVIENKVEGTCVVASSFDEVRYCSECGDEVSRVTIYGTTASHKLGKAVKENVVSATCTAPGTYDQVVYCTVCGTECSRTTVSVGAKGHTIVADPAVAPTCEKTGKTLGSHCSVCGEVIVAQKIVPASGHTEIIDHEVEPTCTRPGKTEGSHCGECGKVLVAQDEIPADGHLDEDGDGICDLDGRDVNDMNPDYDYDIGFGPDYEGNGGYDEDICDRCGREHINFFSEIICLIIRFFRLLGMNV